MEKTWTLFLLALNHLIVCFATGDMKAAFLRSVVGQEISAFKAVFFSRSKLDCVKECGKNSYCSSVAFLPTSKTCYLEPTFYSAAAETSTVTILEKKDAICRDTPTIPHGSVVAPFHRSLTSVSADVACHAGFLWTGSDAVMECPSSGTWTTAGECKQYQWTNPAINVWYSVPLPPTLTWRMCLRGTPLWQGSGNTRFTLNVYDGSNNRLMMADFRYDFGGTPRTTILSNYINGNWGPNNKRVTDNFPFTLNQEFLMVISPASEYALNIHVDGSFHGDLATPISVTEITGIKLRKQGLDCAELNLWCQ